MQTLIQAFKYKGLLIIEKADKYFYMSVFKYCVMYILSVYSINTFFFMNILVMTACDGLIHQYKYE